jgi:hypothetical protein
MKGYLRNITSLWAHTMKRAVGPGAQIPLDELYEQYGKKYNLEPDDEFIRWLQDVKLRDKNKWQIFTENGKPYVFGDLKKTQEVGVTAVAQGDDAPAQKVEEKSRGENVAPMVAKGMTVDDVTGLSVRKSREVIPHIMDVKLLKYSLQQANQMAGKDSLCRIIRKRIQELEISNRG